MDYCENVLNRNLPDSELEYFWLNLKNCLKCTMDNKELNEVKYFSNELDILQKDRQYIKIWPKIEHYLLTELPKFGWRILATNNIEKCSHIETYLKRWRKYNKASDRLFVDTNEFYSFLRMMLLCKKHKVSEDYKVMRGYLVDFSKNALTDYENCQELYDVIIKYAIKNKMYGILDRIKHIYDLSYYLKQNTKINPTETSGLKMIKYFK